MSGRCSSKWGRVWFEAFPTFPSTPLIHYLKEREDGRQNKEGDYVHDNGEREGYWMGTIEYLNIVDKIQMTHVSIGKELISNLHAF